MSGRLLCLRPRRDRDPGVHGASNPTASLQDTDSLSCCQDRMDCRTHYPTTSWAGSGKGEEMPYRSGLMRVLCPECRRKVYLHEEWGYS
jgi:hypothetical protein